MDKKKINPKYRKGKIFGNETYFVDVEKRMRRAAIHKNEPRYENDYNALIKTHDFWKTYDAMNCTTMAENFRRMYMMPANFAKTVYAYTVALSISETTLLRHRRWYAKTYEHLAGKPDANDSEIK